MSVTGPVSPVTMSVPVSPVSAPAPSPVPRSAAASVPVSIATDALLIVLLIVSIPLIPPLRDGLLLLQLPQLPDHPPGLLHLLHGHLDPGVPHVQLPHQVVVHALLRIANGQESSARLTNLLRLRGSEPAVTSHPSSRGNLTLEVVSLGLELITQLEQTLGLLHVALDAGLLRMVHESLDLVSQDLDLLLDLLLLLGSDPVSRGLLHLCQQQPLLGSLDLVAEIVQYFLTKSHELILHILLPGGIIRSLVICLLQIIVMDLGTGPQRRL